MGREAITKSMNATATRIIQSDGLVRKFYSLGNRALPYRIRCQGTYQHEGTYTLTFFNASPQRLAGIRDQLKFDSNVIRWRLMKRAEGLREEAMVHELSP